MGIQRGRRTNKLTICVLAVAALSLLAACSSSSSKSSTSSSGSAAASSSGTPTPKELLIGENTIVTGTSAASYAISQGFEGYLSYVNSQGGVNGYKFKWDTKDNAGTAAQAATVQNQLLAENPFVITVIGTVPVTSAAQVSVNSGSKIPLLISADGALADKLAPTLPGGLYDFVPSYSNLGQYDARFIMTTVGDKNFAVAYENDSLGQGADMAIQSYVSANGGTLAANVPFDATTTDFTPIATKLKASGAKTVELWGNTGVTASLQKAAVTIGYTPQWVVPFFSLATGYLTLAGSAAEGTYVDGITPPPTQTSAPGMTLFNTQMTTYAKTAVTGAGQQGWELAAILVQGVKDASAGGKEVSQQSFVDAVSKINKQVELSPIDYTSGHHWGATQASMFQVKNGAFVQVQPLSKMPGL